MQDFISLLQQHQGTYSGREHGIHCLHTLRVGGFQEDLHAHAIEVWPQILSLPVLAYFMTLASL